MEEMTVNSSGGKQHKVKERCEALFPYAILEVARLRAEGHDKYGYSDDNYLLIEQEENVGRALRHILKWFAGDQEDGSQREHLVHAACRVLMVIEQEMISDKVKREERERRAYAREYGYED